jgi:hypothetical protein
MNFDCIVACCRARGCAPMKHLKYLALLSMAIALAHAASAADRTVRRCDFEVKARCASGEARVTMTDKAVSRVEIDVIWCGLPGKPGYTCSVDVSRDDGESQWSGAEGATVVTDTSLNPTEPDRIKVTVGRNVSIDLKEVQSAGRCGAGAELPQAIVIPANGKTCRVWLEEP